MEILLWLVPPAAVTAAAMAWAGWSGRKGRDEVDREAALARMAAALSQEPPARATGVARPRDRSTGIAVRPSRRAPGAGPR
ncbi:hypothetical protein [Nocardioides perillae]|uniref:Uncharacterized protein n=1 Tax=Nocardioides perillae TaxID=1119534 RepID=A0A7Y9RW92_9ACTN|nr:hypothetical protein [Nocardioides perillae]